jgi:hypothetical protein
MKKMLLSVAIAGGLVLGLGGTAFAGRGINAVFDVDLLRLLRFRDDILEPHLEHAIDELGVLDLDRICESELTSECSVGDTLIEVGLIDSVLGQAIEGSVTLDREDAFLQLELEIVFTEAGDRQLDDVAILGYLLDIIGRIRGDSLLDGACHVLKVLEHIVEAD